MITLVNFKTYRQGKNVLKLAKAISRVDKNTIIAVQAPDIEELSKTKLPVYAQHVDWQKPGRHTGMVLPEAVKENGAIGTLLNHSEHKLSFSDLKKTIKRCGQIGLKTAVFASSIKEAKRIDKLKPTFLIIEPPELIAGKISVSQSKPELIKNVLKQVKAKLLVGAGIHSNEDVKIALRLGASGIAVSSAITKAKKPEKKLKELIK